MAQTLTLGWTILGISALVALLCLPVLLFAGKAKTKAKETIVAVVCTIFLLALLGIIAGGVTAWACERLTIWNLATR